MRDVGGFRMGPFELMELTGLDVTQRPRAHLYNQFFQEPRYRPNLIMRARYEAGARAQDKKRVLRIRRGDEGDRPPDLLLSGFFPSSVWVSRADERATLFSPNCWKSLAPPLEHRLLRVASRLILVTPIGEDATTSAIDQVWTRAHSGGRHVVSPWSSDARSWNAGHGARCSRLIARVVRVRRRRGHGMSR